MAKIPEDYFPIERSSSIEKETIDCVREKKHKALSLRGLLILTFIFLGIVLIGISRVIPEPFYKSWYPVQVNLEMLPFLTALLLSVWNKSCIRTKITLFLIILLYAFNASSIPLKASYMSYIKIFDLIYDIIFYVVVFTGGLSLISYIAGYINQKKDKDEPS